MTKSELIEIISAKQKHLPAKDVELAVKQLLEIMSDALATGERIEIRGFGSFSLHFRPPRQGRNPEDRRGGGACRQTRPAFQAGQGSARARQRRRGPADPRLSEPRSESVSPGRIHARSVAAGVVTADPGGAGASGFSRGISAGAGAGPGPSASCIRTISPGLDYLVSEQPDRALDMFLKLMDANADTIETHFALGALYRRRGEVERAIRIHQNLLAREALAPEHREQALLALAQDYLRAGLLDRAEGLFSEVSEVPRLRASALVALARRLRAPARVAAGARHVSRSSRASRRRRRARWPRTICASWRRSQSSAATFAAAQQFPAPGAARGGAVPARRRCCGRRSRSGNRNPSSRCGCCGSRSTSRRRCCRRSCRICRSSAGDERRDAMLAELVATAAQSRGVGELKSLVFAADRRRIWRRRRRCAPRSKPCSARTRRSPRCGSAAGGELERVAREIGALLAHAERYRCSECGFSARSFYWHCPGVPIVGDVSSPTRSSNCAENPL